MNVLRVEFDGGAIGRFGEPEVEVFAFACFEEEDIVCIVEIGKFVQL